MRQNAQLLLKRSSNDEVAQFFQIYIGTGQEQDCVASSTNSDFCHSSEFVFLNSAKLLAI